MRIDGASKTSAAGSANICDLMSRLDTGDVIRAKVIEITSDEALLRLFDGTSLRAKLAESLDAKPGQTITLSVASKTEGMLVLETVKNFNGRFDIKPDILKNLLESLQLKPDNKNTEVAAELLKAGTPVTKEAVGEALKLMEGAKEMTAEKAVFISSKVEDSTGLDPKLAARLLNGDLKLGRLLAELQNILENATENNENTASSPKNTLTAPEASRVPKGQSAGAFPENSGSAESSALNMQQKQACKSDEKSIFINRSGADTEAGNQQTAVDANKTARNNTNLNQSNNGVYESSQRGNAVSDDSRAYFSNNDNASPNGSPDSSINRDGDSDGSAIIHTMKDAGNANSGIVKNNTLSKVSAGTNAGTTAGVSDEGSESRPAPGAPEDRTVNRRSDPDRRVSDPISKSINAINDMFVDTDSDMLASELNASKLYRELDSRLDSVKAAIHASEMQQAKADMISGAVNLLGDTIRLMEQLNSGGLMYYQMPVKISDNNTTAELYIMKKQKNKKKIDPGDTVMFISLDTVHIGRVETLIDIKNKNISVQMRTESQEISDYIKDYTKDLYNGFSGLGYKLTGIRFKTMDRQADPLMQEKLLEEMRQGYIGRVDFRI